MAVRQGKCRRGVRVVKRQRVAITTRDVELCILVGLCRYLALPQATREFFPSDDRARRRIRQLFDAGLIAVTLIDSRLPNLLSLTRGGVAIVAEHDEEIAERLKLAGPIRLAGVRHHLAIVDCRLYLAALSRQRGTPLVWWANVGGDLARELKLGDLHLEPDGIGELSTPAGLIRIAVEIDCGTQAVSSVVAKKIERYAVCARDGRLDALWVVALGRKDRQAHLRDLIAAAGLGRWARVIPHQHLLPRPVLELPPHPSDQSAAGAAPPPITTSANFSIPQGNRGLSGIEGTRDRIAERGADR